MANCTSLHIVIFSDIRATSLFHNAVSAIVLFPYRRQCPGCRLGSPLKIDYSHVRRAGKAVMPHPDEKPAAAGEAPFA